MEPLRGGKLAEPVPPAVEKIWKEAEVKRTAAEWGLRWVWNRPEVTLLLSGMNEEAHIEENLKIASEAYPLSLTKTEIELVERVKQKYQQLMKVDCTACEYCMPCPAGVDIPSCFDVYNHLHMFGDVDGAKFLYAIKLSGILSGADPGFASECVQCEECMEKCPQHLDIPTFLESVKEELEGTDFEKRIAMAKQFLLNK